MRDAARYNKSVIIIKNVCLCTTVTKLIKATKQRKKHQIYKIHPLLNKVGTVRRRIEVLIVCRGPSAGLNAHWNV